MKRISATITEDLAKNIDIIAKKEKRSFSTMVEILLEQAVKERVRKRKGGSDGLQ